MAEKNFPGPNYNRIIDNDPQIVRVPGAAGDKFVFGWGARPSLLKQMTADPSDDTNNPGQPRAPEMTVKHTG